MIEEKIIVYLDEKEAKMFTMMRFLESCGVFEVKLGRVTLDFDAVGKIGNVKVEYNFKPPREDFTHPIT